MGTGKGLLLRTISKFRSRAVLVVLVVQVVQVKYQATCTEPDHFVSRGLFVCKLFGPRACLRSSKWAVVTYTRKKSDN